MELHIFFGILDIWGFPPYVKNDNRTAAERKLLHTQPAAGGESPKGDSMRMGLSSHMSRMKIALRHHQS